MSRLTIYTIFLFSILSFAKAQDLELANAYYKQGEYDKAVEIFKKLSTNKTQALQIHNFYLNALYKLKDYEQAEKFLKNQIKNFDNVISFKADYVQLLEITNNPELASKEYEKLIEAALKSDNYTNELQNYFYKANKIDKAVDLLIKSREKSKDPNKHDTQLARAYLYLGKKQKMLEEVFKYGLRSKNYNYVQATIQDNIREEEEIETLERMLYAAIQENSNETFFNEILVWHFIQKADYSRAFIQARALDKRLKLEGSKIFEIAGQSYSSKDYKNAVKMYQYIMNEYPDGDFYPYARRWLIQSKEELVKNSFPINNEDILDLINQYDLLIQDLGLNPKTLDAMRNQALLYAFYLNDIDKAILILEKAISVSGNNFKFRDQCKLDLGDIYILKNEPWESTLLYMQVEKSQKEDNLGEIAKLKNAKLQYYTGQFDLSRDILDILKKATTREISNDALQLSLLIQDNTGLDTSEVAMKDFSRIDLLIFQNKYEESIVELSKLFQIYKSHSLADEILWSRANMLLKVNKVEEASADLNNILENYKFDILADDALFLLAKITDEKYNDKPKAMELYKKLLVDYPGSIFGAQARLKFRELRGDFVN
jgi:tetratricopeptide (TPR) repeat protein